MAFCTNCRRQISDASPFCPDCGAVQQQQQQQYQPPQPQQPQYGQPPQQFGHQTQPMQYQHNAPGVMVKKKSNKTLFIVLGAIAAFIAIVVLVIVIVVSVLDSVTGLMEETAVLDYYEMGNDMIPSVKLALGEQRTVVGVNTSISNNVTAKEIKYQVSGTNQNEEMYMYALYLSENGFYALTDFTPSNSSGAMGRNSVDLGYQIVVQIECDRSGYTITIFKEPGEVTLY